MFEKISAPDHVIAMHLSGKLTVDDVAQYKGLFDEKLAKHKQVGVCVDLTGWSDISLEALVKDVSVELALATHLNQMSRIALISDKEWPHAMIHFLAPLMPSIDAKVFTPDANDEALKWVAAVPAADVAAPPAIRFLPTSKDDVYAFEVNGKISAQEMPDVIEKFDTFLKGHEKVRLLNRMKHFGGIDFSVFMQSGLVPMKLAAINKVERYAIVGAPVWMSKVVETLNPFFPSLEMRIFSADKEAEAWAWLGASLAE